MVSTGEFSTVEGCLAAIEQDRNAFAPRFHLVALLREQGRLDEALAAAGDYLNVAPRSAQGFALIAGVYRAKGDIRRAAGAGALAVDLDPSLVAALADLGADLHALGNYGAALAIHDRALMLLGDTPVAALVHTNAGRTSEACGDDGRAIVHYRCALSLLLEAPPELHVMLSEVLLRSGRLDEAWPHLTHRLSVAPLLALAGSATRYLGRVPRWEPGTSIDGKRIVVGHEQGFGDAIMLLRFIPALARSGARVILETLPELETLARTVDGCERVVLGTQPALGDDEVDLYVPLFDLPYVVGATLDTLPAPPYLAAGPVRAGVWAQRFAEHKGLRIGLVWHAGYLHQMNPAKSVGFAPLAPLLDIEGIAFYSLQKGVDETGAPGGDQRVTPLGPHIADFADTAAAIAQLDLVISIDTAVTHVAGALGKPVWTLLSEPADWRWMRHRLDSPWYPSMRLFRQPAPGDWATPLNEIVATLKELVALTSARLL